MSAISALSAVNLFLRDDDDVDVVPLCEASNDYNGRMGARISAVFVILVAGTFGACFPYAASRQSGFNIPAWMFFIAKYFGSGVIVATAFIHLLQPANENLSDECLPSAWRDYPYAFGISLISLFSMFFIEILSFKLLATHGDGNGHSHGPIGLMSGPVPAGIVHAHADRDADAGCSSDPDACLDSNHASLNPEKFSDSKDNTHLDGHSHSGGLHDSDNLIAQMTSVFILEFGIIFHSIFVGLTLAVSGDEFVSLYIVIVFHQMFEGLGLGTRLSDVKWPASYRWAPWCCGLAFGLTTPICIAIGLGVRTTYPPGSSTSLITNGIFDAVSSGILIYTGLVELMANEFLFSSEFQRAPISRIIYAFLVMCCGAGLMALLGRWA
ncbi:membrane zinc transporter [Nadsonia fulvescens var. elongata DSM 6958]|uniref:Membrane zinc transporter n=1 Tax=Nadsonia fulvescens var. elongata DSM 6958 TaxID=857566 RepID=A0A1E3PPH8_9ASCO|nr:membrane zinc transporter [Nadsonia fulvescens var. elongata DSM 6958]